MIFVFLIAKLIPLIYLFKEDSSEDKTSNEIGSNVKMSRTHTFALVKVCTIEYLSFNYGNTERSLLYRL